VKEAMFFQILKNKIQKEIGGKVVKVSDKSSLGIPDSYHLRDSIVTFMETKIGSSFEKEDDGKIFLQPWKIIKKDLRQYEVCKSFSHYALVLYVIYYPEGGFSAVLTIDQIEVLRPKTELDSIPWTAHLSIIQPGHGLSQIKRLMTINREEIYAKLGTITNNRKIF
jgi:hypothetical protein